jgi:hypothetical protein
MITVKVFLEVYCHERELPQPSQQDLESCGRMISHHFRHYWAKEHYDELIPDSGFLVVTEDEKKVVVQGYPDLFKSEMAQRIDLYFVQKNKPKPPPAEPPKPPPKPLIKKERKRIKGPVKVASSKPINRVGQSSGLH